MHRVRPAQPPPHAISEVRAMGLSVGSGVVEAGCKHVLGTRCKRPDMHWSVNGVNAIAALRCCVLSNRFDDFWIRRKARSGA